MINVSPSSGSQDSEQTGTGLASSEAIGEHPMWRALEPSWLVSASTVNSILAGQEL